MLEILKNTLEYLSQRIIAKFDPDIVAITGSVGKTSAKEAVFSILANSPSLVSGSNRILSRKTSANMNNELGMPLAIIADWRKKCLDLVSRHQPAKTKRIRKTIFWLKVIVVGFWKIMFGAKKNYPKSLVLEYGADRPGDIKKMLKIARPKIGIITAIGQTPSHIEFYNDVDELAKEKFKLVESLFSSGWAILNFDDEMVMNLRERVKSQIITFGFNEGADVKIFNFENRSIDGKPEGIFFKIDYKGSVIPISIKNVFGRAQAYAVASAFAVGIIYNLNLVEIAGLIEKYYVPEKRRMNLLQGVKETWIIDDSYNAAPLSVAEALLTLKDLNVSGKKIVVLGDMLELGKYSIGAHENIGKMAGETADVLITVGPRAKFIAEKAKEAGLSAESIFSFDEASKAAARVQEIINEGDLILIKASRGIGLDKVVDEIKL